MQWLPKSIACR